MPEIICTKCERGHTINYHGYVAGDGHIPGGVIRGLLLCHYPAVFLDVADRARLGVSKDDVCNSETVFEIKGTGVSFAPGKLFHEELANVTDTVRGLFSDAAKAFYGQAYRGTLGLCRSAVEQALDEKNVQGKDLWEKIQNCPADIMGPQEKTWANASRLDGSEALHRLMNVTPSQALTSLNMTIALVNHIASWKPPVKQ